MKSARTRSRKSPVSAHAVCLLNRSPSATNASAAARKQSTSFTGARLIDKCTQIRYGMAFPCRIFLFFPPYDSIGKIWLFYAILRHFCPNCSQKQEKSPSDTRCCCLLKSLKSSCFSKNKNIFFWNDIKNARKIALYFLFSINLAMLHIEYMLNLYKMHKESTLSFFTNLLFSWFFSNFGTFNKVSIRLFDDFCEAFIKFMHFRTAKVVLFWNNKALKLHKTWHFCHKYI